MTTGTTSWLWYLETASKCSKVKEQPLHNQESVLYKQGKCPSNLKVASEYPHCRLEWANKTAQFCKVLGLEKSA